MQINAISNISFSAQQNVLENKNAGAEEVKNKPQNTKFDTFAAFLSKSVSYDSVRMSKGREEKDGKYKLAQFGTAALAAGAFITGIARSMKAFKLSKKAKKLAKQAASSDKINELKNNANQKLKTSKGAFIFGIAALAASRIIHLFNSYDAGKTAKERGFMSDDEVELKLLQKKVEKQNSSDVQKPAEQALKAESESIENKITEN